MVQVKHIPMIGKFLIVLAMFGLVAIASVVFSTSKMRQIDDGYSGAIQHQGHASRLLFEASRSLYGAKSAMTDLQISNTDEGNRAAIADLKVQRQAFIDAMAQAKAADPDRANAILQLAQRGQASIDTTCAKALAMGLAATLPNDLIAAQSEHLKSCAPAFPPLIKDLTLLANNATADQDKVDDDLTWVTTSTILITYLAVSGGIVLVMIGGFIAIGRWVSAPVKSLAETMKKLAGGDFQTEVEGTDRRDEIGAMARALHVFKDNGLKLQVSEADAARHRQLAEQERATNEATRIEAHRQQQAVVASIAGGLDRLSKGDLTGRLGQAFTQEYEKLRSDFNATADSLQGAMRTILGATEGINSGSNEIANASDDLARRTEQQAANLEETAAALDQITTTVKKMAASAGEAAVVVAETRDEAAVSGQIVAEAVEAMSKIKQSSYQMSQIIGVIDEIAFQTNLLALNAGVEAARAGEAGRGFAVVASEVRGLAQRSAASAKEIKTLISASASQVESGVVLVEKTGVTLKHIIAKIGGVDHLVREISASSKEQATSLAEVNIAITQMDKIVQQNAAMVEESTAATHTLRNDMENLTSLVGRFQIGQHAVVESNPVHNARAKIAASMRRH